MDSNTHIFNLTKKHTIVDSIEDFGDQRKMGGDIEEDNIRLYIGTKPVLVDIKNFFEKSGKEVPEKFQLFKSYKIYILSHSVGLIKEGGWKKVNQIGYRMEFEENNNIAVLDIMPQARFIKQLGAELKFESSLGLNGSIGVPEMLSKMLSKTELVGVGGELKASADANVVGNISFNCYSSEIQAIGKNGNYSEWQFSRTNLPLHGSDIEMFQTILSNRFDTKIKFRCRAYANISSFFGINTVRRETDWIDIECEVQ